MDTKNNKEKHKEKALFTFLKFTKEGKFAEIDKNSLLYVRIKEQREEPICQEEYYYSIR
jgi:hypothetical protein